VDTVPFFTMQTPREQEARRHVQTKPGVNLSGYRKMWPAFDTVTLAAKAQPPGAGRNLRTRWQAYGG
jgi:hypothetical protein